MVVRCSPCLFLILFSIAVLGVQLGRIEFEGVPKPQRRGALRRASSQDRMIHRRACPRARCSGPTGRGRTGHSWCLIGAARHKQRVLVVLLVFLLLGADLHERWRVQRQTTGSSRPLAGRRADNRTVGIKDGSERGDDPGGPGQHHGARPCGTLGPTGGVRTAAPTSAGTSSRGRPPHRGTWRIGEAKNPGPQRGDDGPSHEREAAGPAAAAAEALRESLLQAALAARTSWTLWAEYLVTLSRTPDPPLASSDGREHSLAAMALVHTRKLAAVRIKWARAVRHAVERASRGAHDQERENPDEGGAERRPSTDVDGSDVQAEIKRMLEGITQQVRDMLMRYSGGGGDDGELEALKAKVQRTVDAVHAARESMLPSQRATLAATDGGASLVLHASPSGGTSSVLASIGRGARAPYSDASAEPAARATGRRRNRGSGRTKKKPHLTVFFGNATSFSDKAESKLLTCGADLWYAVETHLRGRALDDTVKRVDAEGWRVCYSAAAASPTAERGTQGGAMAAAKSHLVARPMLNYIRTNPGYASPKQDLVGFNVGLRGGEVLIFGGYARGGSFFPMAAGIARITQHGLIPFVWIADFTRPPAELEAHPVISGLKAVVVKPRGGSITCHQGRGTLIDFVVCSADMEP